MSNRKRRYSGNDRHFGPLTYSVHNNESWRPFGMILDSGGDEESGANGCNLKLQGFGRTLICELPKILRDYRIKHIATSWDADTVARMGRNYYFEVFSSEFGFTFSDGCLHLYFGPQTHDSTTTKSKVVFLPWKELRFIRTSLYGLNGEHFWTQLDRKYIAHRDIFASQMKAEEECPKATFEFDDYDGQRILATTHIEEREWHHGTGWFKWLSLFRRALIVRRLDIKFSAEVGPEKGSWKGGTCGHSIEMLPGELHESAFRRYCEQSHRSKSGKFSIRYIGQLKEVTT